MCSEQTTERHSVSTAVALKIHRRKDKRLRYPHLQNAWTGTPESTQLVPKALSAVFLCTNPPKI
jgi:hypothetical protein